MIGANMAGAGYQENRSLRLSVGGGDRFRQGGVAGTLYCDHAGHPLTRKQAAMGVELQFRHVLTDIIREWLQQSIEAKNLLRQYVWSLAVERPDRIPVEIACNQTGASCEGGFEYGLIDA